MTTGEWLKANVNIDPVEVKLGMSVMGSDGKTIGRIKEIRGNHFLVDRERARDVYVPMDRVVRIGTDDRGLILERHVVVDVESSGVDEMRWDHP